MRGWVAAALPFLLAGCLQGIDDPGAGPPGLGGPGVRLEDFLSSSAGLDDPVFLTHAGDGSGRLFFVEQRGIIKVWDDGEVQDEAFLDIAAGGPDAKVLAGGERGLLGLAFHPAYGDNGRFFVYYTAPGGDITIAEFRNPDPRDNEADPATFRSILVQEHSEYPNHNGGMLAFGPDGFLYAGLGDGGAGGDPHNHAQDLQSLLGKLLRIDIDGGVGSIPYVVPEDNPFAAAVGRAEVWAYGLRNPWRFSFDRATGDLWIGDVGQSAWEEIDHAGAGVPGVNYGWSRFEGTHKYSDRQADGAVDPVAEYGRREGGASHCSVTGGYVYRGTEHPGLQGTYLFGDYCSGFIWTLSPDGQGGWSMAKALDTSLSISSFGEDELGELYVVDHGGEVHKVAAAN